MSTLANDSLIMLKNRKYPLLFTRIGLNAYALNIRDLKKIFKTSLIHSGTTYYNYLVNLKNINENNLSNNKNNKNIKHHLNNNERRKNFKEFENISNLKYNIYNKNKRNKDSKTLRRFDGLKNDHVNIIIR